MGEGRPRTANEVETFLGEVLPALMRQGLRTANPATVVLIGRVVDLTLRWVLGALTTEQVVHLLLLEDDAHASRH